MKTGFKDRTEIKKQQPQDKPKDYKSTLGWDFRCPQYDQRSSGFVNAGTKYGTGVNQPVGHKGDPDKRAECLPYGKVKTLAVDINKIHENPV